MPTGTTLRADGESHLEAWASICRLDPCSFCGDLGGTIDHIVPQNPLVPRPFGGKHSWLNYAGCCTRCNSRKKSGSLLMFLAVRRGINGAVLKPAAEAV
jgi:hypothetical protein